MNSSGLQFDDVEELFIGSFTFSSLLCQLKVHSNRDTEGFLFGSVIHESKKTVADDHIELEKKKTIVAIQTIRILDAGHIFTFYNSNGSLERMSSCLETLLSQECTDGRYLVGWFKFRHHSSLRPSLREISVHTQLETLYDNYLLSRNLKPRSLFLGIFTSNDSISKATKTFDFRFIKIRPKEENCIVPINLTIANLLHSSQAEYEDFKSLLSFSYGEDPDLQFIVSKVTEQTKTLEAYYSSKLKQLKDITEQVNNSSSEVLALEQYIRTLEEKRKQEQNRIPQCDGESPIAMDYL